MFVLLISLAGLGFPSAVRAPSGVLALFLRILPSELLYIYLPMLPASRHPLAFSFLLPPLRYLFLLTPLGLRLLSCVFPFLSLAFVFGAFCVCSLQGPVGPAAAF